MDKEEKPKPLINQITVDWLEHIFPEVPYKNGMSLAEIAFDAGPQRVINRMKRELRR